MHTQQTNHITTSPTVVRRVIRRARVLNKTVDEYLTALLDAESGGKSLVQTVYAEERFPTLIALNDERFPQEEARIPNHMLRSLATICERSGTDLKGLLEKYVSAL